MLTVDQLFAKELEKMFVRGWDCIYVAVDLHDTCIDANYSDTNTPTNIFKQAIEPLRLLSEISHFKLIMWTCSHPEQVTLYDKIMRDEGIHFDYFNENPEVKTEGTLTYGNYDKKFYANVILDDKAGFEPKDWYAIKQFLILNYKEYEKRLGTRT